MERDDHASCSQLRQLRLLGMSIFMSYTLTICVTCVKCGIGVVADHLHVRAPSDRGAGTNDDERGPDEIRKRVQRLGTTVRVSQISPPARQARRLIAATIPNRLGHHAPMVRSGAARVKAP